MDRIKYIKILKENNVYKLEESIRDFFNYKEDINVLDIKYSTHEGSYSAMIIVGYSSYTS